MANVHKRRRKNKQAQKEARRVFFEKKNVLDEPEVPVSELLSPEMKFEPIAMENELREIQMHFAADNTPSSDEEFMQVSDEDAPALSRKQLRRQRADQLPLLKAATSRPDLVDTADVTAPDPTFLVHLKALPGTVPVPPHWKSKRRFLATKAMRSSYQLPPSVEATGVGRVRAHALEHERTASAAQLARERVRPKMGKLGVDYQILFDAFHKHRYTPRLTRAGDVFYEGRDSLNREGSRRFTPGVITRALREALGMDKTSPPPWLHAMQRKGPPPAYPRLCVPGVNMDIPKGMPAGYGTHGWGARPTRNGEPVFLEPGTEQRREYYRAVHHGWADYVYA
ncbi:protein of unknown function (DUF382) [Carpediemonas membranifera]|uniref:PSP proline-rich domain-containing protein n=1 Tax=Carpediemonas membranifera TaxID=201153 RepID=A0A8J6B666_9EUKA|nr:protein of unknown function (DUF382) [Carpediemonas membranifera]|eukprot:KAG9395104.1 protein of unknown function (DUF382) [Carpediemonas membranifera]